MVGVVMVGGAVMAGGVVMTGNSLWIVGAAC